MAASNEQTEWHLTPSGWVRGNRKEDFLSYPDTPNPEDRVLTCIFIDSHSGYGSGSRYTQELWRIKDGDSQINALIAKYGECPQRL